MPTPNAVTKLHIQCPYMQKALRYSFDTEGRRNDERTLRGEAALYEELCVESQGRKRNLTTVDLIIKSTPGSESQVVAPSEDETLEQERIIFGQQIGAVFFVQHKSFRNLPEPELSITVSAAQFEVLWQDMNNDCGLYLTVRLRGLTERQSLLLSDEGSVTLRAHANLRVVPTGAASTKWHASHVSREIREALSVECMPGNHYSLPTIASELANAVGQVRCTREEREEMCEHANGLLRDTRVAFHEQLQLTEHSYGNTWNLSARAFEDAVVKLDPKEAARHKDNYNRVWRHFPLTNVIAQGEQKAGAQAEGYGNNVELLESLAQALLSDRRLASPTLEWALLNALVYAECIAFAQHVIPRKSLFGMPIQSPLVGLATWKSWGKQVGASFASLAWESAKIFGTVVVTHAITSENAVAAWTVATGVTAARWIRRAVLWRELHPEVRHLALLEKMIAVHNLLARTDFNPRSLRQQLDNVTREGAVFSPWVFHIVDAQIARHSKFSKVISN